MIDQPWLQLKPFAAVFALEVKTNLVNAHLMTYKFLFLFESNVAKIASKLTFLFLIYMDISSVAIEGSFMLKEAVAGLAH